MRQQSLGPNDLQVSAVGYGAMVLSPGHYAAVDDSSSTRALRHAVDSGLTLIDTSDAYGDDGHNERLIGRAIKSRRDEITLATKFGIERDPSRPGTPRQLSWDIDLRINADPDHALASLEGSLRRLEVETIDLWYLHWPEPGRPIEETVGAMAQAVSAGKVRHLGLSNVTADELRRAAAIHPIAAVQAEYSWLNRYVEDELLPACRELGVGLVAWSPLGFGLLSGQVKEVAADDFRQRLPQSRGENLKSNNERLAPMIAFAERRGMSTAQLALAWLMHQDGPVVPIPGSRTPAHISDNAAAAQVRLDAAELEEIELLLPTPAGPSAF